MDEREITKQSRADIIEDGDPTGRATSRMPAEHEGAAGAAGTTLSYGPSLAPGRPATERYEKLLATLTDARCSAEAGKDPLAAALAALVGVLDFLQADPLVHQGALDRPLAVLARNVLDVLQGAKPPIFFTRERPARRPKNESIHAARAVMACCVGALIEASMSRQDAAAFVVAEARRVGVKSDLNTKGLLRYRDELGGGRAPERAQSMFWQMDARWKQVQLQHGSDLRAIQQVVRNSLCAVSNLAF